MPSPLISFRLPPPLPERLAQRAITGESLSQTAQRLFLELLDSAHSEGEPASHRISAVEARLASLELRLGAIESQRKVARYKR